GQLVKVVKLDKFANDFALSVEQIFPNDTFVAEKRNGLEHSPVCIRDLNFAAGRFKKCSISVTVGGPVYRK
ncbi:hypothetical protein, partial [Gemmiger formicilis]|uniref:hypothetical protein n=1 Tax=Gemmiger formicilis TaxID=745368 RepID=UPI001957EAC5